MIFNDPQVISAYSKRPENMSLNCGDTAGSLENRKNFLKSLGIDYRDLICAKQTHSANIKIVGQADRGRGALTFDSGFDDTDAFITNVAQVPLAVFTADCLSVFLFDPLKKVIAIVHAGWKGSQQEISAKTVNLMRGKFNCNPLDLLAGFGPSIGQNCCEVGSEFKDYFTFGLSEKNGKLYLDVPAVNRKQLLDCGISEKNIFDPRECTVCMIDKFFSFRKENSSAGRMISVIMLK